MVAIILLIATALLYMAMTGGAILDETRPSPPRKPVAVPDASRPRPVPHAYDEHADWWRS